MSNRPTLVFTGGHHTSALVVAKKIQANGESIIWFGHRHSMWGDTSDSAEYQEVTQAGIKFYDLKAGKFYKMFHPLQLIRIPIGFFQSLFLLMLLRPRGIVSFGGYLAVPTIISGWLLGIPSLTHEQTVTAGLANKIISLFVKKIAVSWAESAKFYPRSKVVVTGLPLRPEILKIKNKKLSPSSLALSTIYVTGGKNGSQTINQVIFSLLPNLTKRYRIIHQTGYRDLPLAQSQKFPNYVAFDYDSAKAIEALSLCDLVISRAGAHIVYELAVLGKPGILIPIPWVSHNEQMQNAKLLAARHLAVILPQHDLSPKSLLIAIDQAKSLKFQKTNSPPNGTDNLIQLIKQEFRL